MEKNSDSAEKYGSFDIADLPTYGYTYKEEESPFDKEFGFAPAPNKETGPGRHLDSSALTRPRYLKKDSNIREHNLSFPAYKQPPEPQEIVFHRNRMLSEEHKSFDYGYTSSEEQAVFVNALQYPYIKRRKERRDYLDTLEKKKNLGYQHESRHKHAMKRPRAPSGRFLTKEEALEQEKRERRE